MNFICKTRKMNKPYCYSTLIFSISLRHDNNRAYSFSGVTNKIHHCLCFLCENRHLVPALVSHTSVIFVCDTKLVYDTNTCACDTNAGQDGGYHMENVNNDEFYL